LQCYADWLVDAACALGFCGWKGEGCATVAEVEEFFAKLCQAADQALGEASGVHWFLNWYDETPRDLMRRELLAEVRRALVYRTAALLAA
jgi:hypothetical protein